MWDRREEDPDLLRHYAVALIPWWKSIIAATFIAVLVAGTLAKFVLTKWYRAEAVLRPTASTAMESRLSGILSSFGGPLGGLAAGAAGAPGEAQAYVSTLSSFAFMTSLAQHHNLLHQLLPDKSGSPSDFASSRYLKWIVYRKLRRRFHCDYSLTTGNMNLSYEDRDPAKAERILGFFIDDLREKLRRRQVQDAASAIASLEEEVKKSSDPLLETQLYELIAKQLQREKLAQVQADFAFTPIEPPTASDRPDRPQTRLDCALAAVLTMLVFVGFVLFIYPLFSSDSDNSRPPATRTLRDTQAGTVASETVGR